MTKSDKRKHVLYLNLTKFYNIATHRGIVEFASRNGWVLSYQAVDLASGLAKRAQAFDGVICYAHNAAEIHELLRGGDVPVVGTSASALDAPIKHVVFDHAAIGKMAAEYLINKGFQRLVLVYSGVEQERRAQYRFPGVEEAARDHDATAECLALDDFSNSLSGRELPFAVILLNDTLALDTVFALSDAGLNVPLDVAVLGIDDDPLYCETSGVTLSSVRINSARRGRIAAECLSRMMQGVDEPADPVYIQPDGITERASTNVFAIPHPPTVRALHYIHGHIADPSLNVSEIARHSGVCRRRLETAFMQYLRRSIKNEILELRMDKAIEMIKHTNSGLFAVADECGFSSHQSMSRIFKRKLGRTPSSFRKGR